ncbi:hypothetical protein CIG75_06750 [Tumebacillus algifaecis]|uniref:EcsC family protein n=1 Tax=Tumebacillus algifaecis TaxID=1214604 RepID=A0A223CZD7_9BACL|nr:EcsC family protein [Tumebacillus algifaecis]ASS74701.1 hypothetical protein CIG75_06750 [Tumebacillus algifaecis]
METSDQLHLALQEIEIWEQEQKDLWFWEKLGRLPFVMLDKLTPRFLKEKMGQAIDEMMSYVDTGGSYLIQTDRIVKRFAKIRGESVTQAEIATLPLAAMDEVANELRASRSTFAKWQGASTGIGGIFTLAIDIPMLLGLSLKVLQEMAVSYGYDPNDKAERLFIIKCLQFSSSDIVGKQAILEELAAYSDPAQKSGQMFAQLQGWREVVITLTDNMGWKKLFQLIPIAGILFGAFLNKKTIEDVAETGKMLYKKRRILERLQTNNS